MFSYDSHKKKINSLNGVKLLLFVREARCVDCEVWTKYLYIIQMNFRVQDGRQPGFV